MRIEYMRKCIIMEAKIPSVLLGGQWVCSKLRVWHVRKRSKVKNQAGDSTSRRVGRTGKREKGREKKRKDGTAEERVGTE